MLIDEDFIVDSIHLDNDELELKYKDEFKIIYDTITTFRDDKFIILRMLIAAYKQGRQDGSN